ESRFRYPSAICCSNRARFHGYMTRTKTIDPVQRPNTAKAMAADQVSQPGKSKTIETIRMARSWAQTIPSAIATERMRSGGRPARSSASAVSAPWEIRSAVTSYWKVKAAAIGSRRRGDRFRCRWLGRGFGRLRLRRPEHRHRGAELRVAEDLPH